MYTFNFIHETDAELQLDIEVGMYATEDDYTIEDVTVYDAMTGDEIKIEHLSEKDQRSITDKAESIASDKAYDAYQDALDAAGDAAYESWRERQWG